MPKPTIAKPKKDGQGHIWRPWRTLPNGTVIWAKNYGLKAWKIPIAEAENDNDKGS